MIFWIIVHSIKQINTLILWSKIDSQLSAVTCRPSGSVSRIGCSPAYQFNDSTSPFSATDSVGGNRLSEGSNAISLRLKTLVKNKRRNFTFFHISTRKKEWKKKFRRPDKNMFIRNYLAKKYKIEMIHQPTTSPSISPIP